jgi:hypothetical protein
MNTLPPFLLFLLNLFLLWWVNKFLLFALVLFLSGSSLPQTRKEVLWKLRVDHLKHLMPFLFAHGFDLLPILTLNFTHFLVTYHPLFIYRTYNACFWFNVAVQILLIICAILFIGHRTLCSLHDLDGSRKPNILLLLLLLDELNLLLEKRTLFALILHVNIIIMIKFRHL